MNGKKWSLHLESVLSHLGKPTSTHKAVIIFALSTGYARNGALLNSLQSNWIYPNLLVSRDLVSIQAWAKVHEAFLKQNIQGVLLSCHVHCPSPGGVLWSSSTVSKPPFLLGSIVGSITLVPGVHWMALPFSCLTTSIGHPKGTGQGSHMIHPPKSWSTLPSLLPSPLQLYPFRH